MNKSEISMILLAEFIGLFTVFSFFAENYKLMWIGIMTMIIDLIAVIILHIIDKGEK